MRKFGLTLLPLMLALSGLLWVPTAGAVGPGELVVAAMYPSITVDKGKPVTFPIEVFNKSQNGQDVELSVDAVPDGWTPALRSGGFNVRKVWVPGGKSQSLDLSVKIPDDAKSQDYKLALTARTPDRTFEQKLDLLVGIQDRPAGGLKLTTQFPQLRGPAGNRFEFKLDLNNEADEERTINFAAKLPGDGWEINFKPAYETKNLTSLRLKAGDSKGMDVEVTPPERVQAGEYDVEVTASAGNDRAQQSLRIVVIGNYKLDLGTESGLLNTRATAGEQTTTTLIVKNTGSAPLQNVSFSTSRPDGWEVTFTPDKIDSLPPREQREVNMAIKPSGRALAGDYMLSTSASASQTSASRDLRVTVETPTTWGLAGAAVVVIVVLGLAAMFTKLSRR